MKKLICVCLVLVLALASLVACGGEKNTEADYKLGIGTAVSENLDNIKLSITTASVVLDADGKVALCRLDTVDVQPVINDDGTFTPAATYKTKAELGADYGMLSDYGSKLAEWDDQAKFFETYVVGKTVSEISAIKTKDADLATGCTIDVTDFVKAVVAACNSEHKVDFKASAALAMGLDINAALKDKEGNANFTADMSAVVVADGKIVAAVIDSLEANMTVAEGAGTELSYPGTKLAQGDAYGMLSDYGSKLAEWYDQAQAYANTAVGKTTSEVASLATEGVAGCTIYVGGYKTAMVDAAAKVR